MGLGGSRQDMECSEGSWRVREGLGGSGRVLRVWEDPDGLRVSRRVHEGLEGFRRVHEGTEVWEGLGVPGRVQRGPEA